MAALSQVSLPYSPSLHYAEPCRDRAAQRASTLANIFDVHFEGLLCRWNGCYHSGFSEEHEHDDTRWVYCCRWGLFWS